MRLPRFRNVLAGTIAAIAVVAVLLFVAQDQVVRANRDRLRSN